MDILGLPGRNEATEVWLGQVIDACDLDTGSSTVQRYQCWDDGAEFDLAAEVARACAIAANLVIAKSMGTRVATHAAHSGGLTATEYVLIGIPLAAYEEGEIELLRDLCAGSRVLIIQQTDDFLGGFEQVKSAVAVDGHQTVFVEVPGSDHIYSDVAELGRIVCSWKTGPDTVE